MEYLLKQLEILVDAMETYHCYDEMDRVSYDTYSSCMGFLETVGDLIRKKGEEFMNEEESG